MNLTKLQLDVLKKTSLLREKPPTLRGSIKSAVFSKCYFLYIFSILCSAFLWWNGSPEIGGISIGIFCGYIIKDIASVRIGLKLWPLNAEIIDWKRVDELMQAHENKSDSHQTGIKA
jgi:hypothetical protein